MKKLAFLTALMLIGMNAFSQAVTELRPFWVKQVPQIPVGANYFVNWGRRRRPYRDRSHQHGLGRCSAEVFA